jgi:hypothetical protein
VGRNDHRLIEGATIMSPRADTTTVGHQAARATPTTRRGTPWQDRSPSDLWPAAPAATAAVSQGPPPAHPRHAISTRVHQTGGASTRSAPTRGAHPPRPPSNQSGGRLTRRVKTVRPRAAALRALRLDPTGRRRLSSTGRRSPHHNRQTSTQHRRHLTMPFHIRSRPTAATAVNSSAGPPHQARHRQPVTTSPAWRSSTVIDRWPLPVSSRCWCEVPCRSW